MPALALAAFILFLPGGLLADTAAAKAAYVRGAQAMAAKNYAAAIPEFENSLKEDPNYYFSHKQLGTAYYMQGDKAAALEHYDAYLAKAPNDAQMKAFADKMRPVGGAAGANGAMPVSAAIAPVSHPALGTGFGLRLGAGWGLANSQQAIGSDASGNPYAVGMGAGLVYQIEALYALNQNWELGLGSTPLSVSGAFSTQTQTNFPVQNTTKIEGGTLPIFFMLYARAPLGKSMAGVVGFGPSFGLGGTVTATYEDKNSPGTNDVTKGTDKYTLESGLGYRGYLGGEFVITKHILFFFGLELHDVSLGVGKRTIEETTDELNGDKTTTTVNYEYSSSPPQVKTGVSTFTSTSSGGVNTTVNTYDNGNYAYTSTSTFTFATGRTDTKNVITQKSTKTTADFNRLAPVIGVTIRF